ncbi:hypothetical protein [Infirmifilum sp. NZ]|uniref:TackOD1 domain-containing metal-binding protein n=1 Tax=Infirmifilum sp. NZ TaxID=2926850 RepID=UPI00279A478A|nr:hypothetical protein [Infirmifilum sp. NZ]UNQ72838.1 hypothetical protein MOV14_06920 [Infirmifilum sp. NZ]
MAGPEALHRSEAMYLKSLAGALQELVVCLFESGVSEVLSKPAGTSPCSRIAEKYGLSQDALLEEAVKRGILKPLVADRLVFCPKCGHTGFKVRYNCPSCGSQDVERNTLFSHVPCGYIGVLEGAPKDARGNRLCPKCSRPLGAQGRDWIVIGVTYRCRSCGLTFNVPVASLECLSCGAVFDHKDAVYREVYRYSVERTVLAEIYGQILSRKIADAAASQGYKVHIDAEVTSLSGLKKRVPMLLEKGSQRFVVYTVYPRDADPAKVREEVLSTYGKTLDTGEKHLIVGVRVPTDLSRKPEHVEVISGESSEEAIRKLRERLK